MITTRLAGHWPLTIPPALLAFLAWRPATQGPTTCPFAIITGVACPLCGGTRAAAALVQGNLTAAWEMHPIIFVVAPLGVLAYLRWLRTRNGGPPVSARAVNVTLSLLGIALLGIWIARGMTGTLPPV